MSSEHAHDEHQAGKHVEEQRFPSDLEHGALDLLPQPQWVILPLQNDRLRRRRLCNPIQEAVDLSYVLTALFMNGASASKRANV